MAKILYDKINKREARIQWFTDQEGNVYIDTDPRGVQMSGNITIRYLVYDDVQYEVREVEN